MRKIDIYSKKDKVTLITSGLKSEVLFNKEEVLTGSYVVSTGHIDLTSTITIISPTVAFTGTPNIGYTPLTVSFTDLSTNAVSWLWNFGDGGSSTLQNPTYVYNTVGTYTVELTVNDGAAIESKTDYVSVGGHSSGNVISNTGYKTSTKFITLGWIKNPVINDGDSLIPLAVGDLYNNVLNTNNALAFQIRREDKDYRLIFNNSKSKLINKVSKIKINDGNWHLLGWICTDDYGSMEYFIDDYVLAPEDGADINNHAYSIAYSLSTRQGGGDVWCPYLTTSGQSIQLFNWRFGEGFTLDDNWIRKLNAIDRVTLGI